MQKLLPFVCVILSSASFAQNYPPEPTEAEQIDPQREMANLGYPMGVWEGIVVTLYDPVGMNRNQREGYRMRLTIREQSAEIVVTDEDGTLRRFEGEVYIYHIDNTVLVSYVMRNGAFVEYQSIALGQIERDKLKGYLSRIVHNLSVPNTSPWRVIPVYSLVNLDRVQ